MLKKKKENGLFEMNCIYLYLIRKTTSGCEFIIIKPDN